MRALVIEHDPGVPAGLVEEWLSGRGADLDVWRIATDSREPDPGAYDLVVTLGSETAAYDDTVPWVAREQQLLRDAFAADVPVLGICFGSQSLARALGGRAMRAHRSEIGWIEIDSREPSLVPAGPWLQWHHDTFAAPAGATVLAHSAAGPQAYTIGRSLGVQFHPEVTPQIMEAWVTAYRHELDQQGVDPDRLLKETYDRAEESRAAAWRLFDGFLARARRVQEAVGGS